MVFLCKYAQQIYMLNVYKENKKLLLYNSGNFYYGNFTVWVTCFFDYISRIYSQAEIGY